MAIMRPEKEERAQRKRTRCGLFFDIDVDRYLPANPTEIPTEWTPNHLLTHCKNTKDYYKSQCSFRGLKTSGDVADLQRRLMTRDVSKDAAIKEWTDEITRQLVEHYDEMERLPYNYFWWYGPESTLDERAGFDAALAMQENLEDRGELKKSCHIFMKACPGLEEAALKLGLAYRAIEDAPKEYTNERSGCCEIVGQRKVVDEVAERIIEVSNRQRDAGQTTKRRKKNNASPQAVQEVVLPTTQQLLDWDITGTWKVKCDELAMYNGNGKQELTMEIWLDDFELDDSSDDGESSSGDQEEEDERAAAFRYQRRVQRSQSPRFCAEFNFGLLQGVMLIYRGSSGLTASIKDYPIFDCSWRGRSAEDLETVTNTDPLLAGIYFGAEGRTFKATFKCPYLPNVILKGRKTERGFWHKKSSERDWNMLSTEQHERERKSSRGRR